MVASPGTMLESPIDSGALNCRKDQRVRSMIQQKKLERMASIRAFRETFEQYRENPYAPRKRSPKKSRSTAGSETEQQ